MRTSQRPGTLSSAPPRVSVVVRSYNRLAALAELMQALLAQDHDSFEVVVVEQSTVRPHEDAARVEQLTADPRVRLLRFQPLGGPGARNAGVRAARGELLVFIDDDDLPGSVDWLRRHESNFDDPRCLGVTGRFIHEDEQSATPYVDLEKARKKVLTFNLLRWQRVYVYADTLAKQRVESLMGGNAAIRRSTLERFGLWDECTPIEDEPSLAYRIVAGKRDDEYLLFDPELKMVRRLGVPGGMAKRTMSPLAYSKGVFTFMHNIIGYYFPMRFLLLYPVYIYWVVHNAAQWIWGDSKMHPSFGRRVVGIVGLSLMLLPMWAIWLVQLGYRRIRHGALAHRPTLDPVLTLDVGTILPAHPISNDLHDHVVEQIA